MATLFDLKEHLEGGGKIIKSDWEEGYVCLDGGYLINDEGEPTDVKIFDDDYEPYIEPKIREGGVYASRTGHTIFINKIVGNKAFGVIKGESGSFEWNTDGTFAGEYKYYDILLEKEI